MSITTIICSGCGAILRIGNEGSEREYKICPTCVVKQNKHHVPLVGVAQDGRTRFAVEDELIQLKKRISKLSIEIPYQKIEDEYCAVIEIKDRTGHLFAEIAFSEVKLREIADELANLKKCEA